MERYYESTLPRALRRGCYGLQFWFYDIYFCALSVSMVSRLFGEDLYEIIYLNAPRHIMERGLTIAIRSLNYDHIM